MADKDYLYEYVRYMSFKFIYTYTRSYFIDYLLKKVSIY